MNTIDTHEAGLLAQAASKAAKNKRRVMVVAAYETEPKHRVLKWEGAHPYVVIGTRQARHREYLTGFRSLHAGALFIFTSAMRGR